VREVDASTEVVSGKPVGALLEASEQADLVVLGSRGLHGLRALGSVSERVAHEASCSVLVVR
jgi:nucleotide-binding universal stress UspA family protein